MLLKRFCAYFLDFTFISFFITLVSQIKFLNPHYDDFYEASDKYAEVYKNIIEGNNITEIDSQEIQNLLYKIQKYGINISIIEIVCLILYYGGFQAWNKGQTLGKKIMRLKVVDNNTNEKASFFQLTLRSIILYNVYGEIINVILLNILNQKAYIVTNSILGTITSIIFYISIVMILMRKDKRGLHDVISNTKVIQIENKNECY